VHNAKILIAALGPALFAASPARAADISGNVTVVSDYRYRGLSLSDGKPALQGELDLDAGGGFYGGLWGSTIRDEGKTRSEVDLIGGKEFELAPAITLDLSATYYTYPSASEDDYFEGTASVSAEHGPITGKAGVSFAPEQRALENETGRKLANTYYFVGADYQLPHRLPKLSAQFGYERGPFDANLRGGKWDWNLAAQADLKRVSLLVMLIDSSASRATLLAALSLKI